MLRQSKFDASAKGRKPLTRTSSSLASALSFARRPRHCRSRPLAVDAPLGATPSSRFASPPPNRRLVSGRLAEAQVI